MCDVTSEEAVTALFDGVVAAHGRVDAVVNSAGTSTLAAVAPEGTRSRSQIRVSGSGTLRDALRAGLETREENPRKSA